MAKVKVYELAKELNIQTKEIINFLEKKKISSCIIPKEQRNPQKKRPHRAVIRNTMETRSSCGNSPPKEKRPPVSAVNISRTAENTMINNPGYRIKAAA